MFVASNDNKPALVQAMRWGDELKPHFIMCQCRTADHFMCGQGTDAWITRIYIPSYNALSYE